MLMTIFSGARPTEWVGLIIARSRSLNFQWESISGFMSNLRHHLFLRIEEAEMSKLESVFQSRRVWLAVAGVAVAISEELGVSIPAETIQQIVLMFAAWIIGDSVRKTE